MAKKQKKKTYSRQTKNRIVFGIVSVFILLIIITITNQAAPDLTFRQPRQDLILYIRQNTKIAQSLPAESCWNHKYHLPLVIDPLPAGSEGTYWLDINITTLADPDVEIAEPIRYTITQSLSEITFSTPTSPEPNLECYIQFYTNLPQDLVGLWVSDGNTLDNATIFFNGEPADYDLVFNSYKPIKVNDLFSSFGNAILPTLRLFGLSMVYLLTGMGLLILLKKEDEKLQPILSLFLGIASTMILVLVLSIAKTRIENWMVFGWTGFITILAVVKILLKATSLNSLKAQLASLRWQDGLVALGFVLLLLIRVSQTDGLFVPSWMDSIFHANLVEGFLEQGHIPANLNYHFGYHLLTFLNCNLFAWEIPTSMLMTGQWLSTLLSLALFYYIERIYRSRTIAIFSVLVFSMFSVFPAYLVNWSRFSILLGSAFALIIAGKFFAPEYKWTTASIIPAGILLLAQIMTHYTSVVLTGFICLIPALALLKQFNPKESLKTIKKNIPTQVLLLAGVSILSIVVFILSRVLSMVKSGEFANILSSSQDLTGQFSFQYFWYLASDISGWFVLLIGAGGILWMLFAGKPIKEKKILQGTWVWFILLVLFVAVQNGIFGGSQPSLINVFIWFFIPLAISAGFFLERLIHIFADIYPKPGKLMLPGAMLLMIIVGVFISPIIINPLTIMYSEADQLALQWVKQNLTEDDWILINAAPFEDRLQPSDGGGWIPFQSDLNTSHPDLDQVDDFPSWFSSVNIDYIYQGSQGNAYDFSFLQEENLELVPVFEKNGIRILRVDHTP